MTKKGDAAKTVARNLHEAIERVREDVARVEFWADAVAGFTQPVPDYKSDDVKVWLPREQAQSFGQKPEGAAKKRPGKPGRD